MKNFTYLHEKIISSGTYSFEREFIKELKSMYWCEKQVSVLLRKMQRATSTLYLKASFKGHYNATQEHIARIEKIFNLLSKNKSSAKCAELESFILEVKAAINTTEKRTLDRELALIAVSQKIEEFEIRKYNRLISLANELGNFKCILLLEQTLIEEQEAEETFAAVMEDTLRDELFIHVNLNAEEEEEEQEELEAV